MITRAESRLTPGSRTTPPLTAAAVWDALVKALTKAEGRKASRQEYNK